LAKSLRPDVNTRFHIDYDWWAEQRRDLRTLIWEQLCPACKEKLGADNSSGEIDWVDPDTAEVIVVDGLTYSLRECCSKKEDYLTRATPLAASIFRVLVANRNAPLSALEFHEKIGRSDPDTILRVLLSKPLRTHYGVRPIL
jgi:hypothetical protein